MNVAGSLSFKIQTLCAVSTLILAAFPIVASAQTWDQQPTFNTGSADLPTIRPLNTATPVGPSPSGSTLPGQIQTAPLPPATASTPGGPETSSGGPGSAPITPSISNAADAMCNPVTIDQCGCGMTMTSKGCVGTRNMHRCQCRDVVFGYVTEGICVAQQKCQALRTSDNTFDPGGMLLRQFLTGLGMSLGSGLASGFTNLLFQGISGTGGGGGGGYGGYGTNPGDGVASCAQYYNTSDISKVTTDPCAKYVAPTSGQGSPIDTGTSGPGTGGCDPLAAALGQCGSGTGTTTNTGDTSTGGGTSGGVGGCDPLSAALGYCGNQSTGGNTPTPTTTTTACDPLSAALGQCPGGATSTNTNTGGNTGSTGNTGNTENPGGCSLLDATFGLCNTNTPTTGGTVNPGTPGTNVDTGCSALAALFGLCNTGSNTGTPGGDVNTDTTDTGITPGTITPGTNVDTACTGFAALFGFCNTATPSTGGGSSGDGTVTGTGVDTGTTGTTDTGITPATNVDTECSPLAAFFGFCNTTPPSTGGGSGDGTVTGTGVDAGGTTGTGTYVETTGCSALAAAWGFCNTTSPSTGGGGSGDGTVTGTGVDTGTTGTIGTGGMGTYVETGCSGLAALFGLCNTTPPSTGGGGTGGSAATGGNTGTNPGTIYEETHADVCDALGVALGLCGSATTAGTGTDAGTSAGTGAGTDAPNTPRQRGYTVIYTTKKNADGTYTVTYSTAVAGAPIAGGASAVVKKSRIINQPGSGLSGTEIPGGERGDILVRTSDGTLIAGTRDEKGNVEVAGFYGSQAFTNRGSESLMANWCRTRPWASGFLSKIVAPTFFDGVCKSRGYQVGEPPPAPVPATPSQVPVKAAPLPPKQIPVAKPTPTSAATTSAPKVPPRIDIWAVPATVPLGTRTSIFWSAQNVVECKETSSDGQFSHKTLSGGSATVPIIELTTFTITCLVSDGTIVTKSVAVSLKL